MKVYKIELEKLNNLTGGKWRNLEKEWWNAIDFKEVHNLDKTLD